MEKEMLEKYKKAGEIAARALQYAKGLVKEGALIVEIVDRTEEKIGELGGQPAFPMNISINDIAAHYSPTADDRTAIKKEDYVKLDVGVHVDGYIGDNAITVRLAGEDKLIECSRKMLEKALSMFVPGTTIAEVGAAVEETARGLGFNPVTNLTGHSLARYNLHAGHVIPNVKNNNSKFFEEGEVYAVEPFATSGAGAVKDSEPALIFRWIADKPSRMPEARKILELGKTSFSKLPFAKRWINLPRMKKEMALRQLTATGAIYPYKILKEVSGGAVSQAEHTVMVGEKPLITTKI
ncbi:MAG: type II methionyl aminopeptidase [Candidatus Aenigmatarchaeota archaeon]